MEKLRKLQSWISAYEKANNCFPDPKAIKFKIKELLKESSANSKSKSPQIFFRESKWSDYQTLRTELAKDPKFVKEYSGVDLKAYIDQAMAWSEKNNQSTDLGWKLTLLNWMRRAKSNGQLIMKPVSENKPTGHINY
jgi:hypothetical protein